jgi:hypothetical protein
MGVKLDIVYMLLFAANIIVNCIVFVWQYNYFQNNKYYMYIYEYGGEKYYNPDNFALNIAAIVLSIIIALMYFVAPLQKSIIMPFCIVIMAAQFVLVSISVFIYLYNYDYINHISGTDYTDVTFANNTYTYPSVPGTCKHSNPGEIFCWFVNTIKDTCEDKSDKRDCISFSSKEFEFEETSEYESIPELSCSDIDSEYDNLMLQSGYYLCAFSLMTLVIIVVKYSIKLCKS